MKKRILAVLLAACMALSLLPATALAIVAEPEVLTDYYVDAVNGSDTYDGSAATWSGGESTVGPRKTMPASLTGLSIIHVMSSSEDFYALARILAGTQIANDFARFAYASDAAAATVKAALSVSRFILTADVTLTNYQTVEGTKQSNGFAGIPAFGGEFDGNDKTITLDIDFAYYPAASMIGGVFAEVTQGAHIFDLTLDGSATGAFTLGKGLVDTGLLCGATTTKAAFTGGNTVIENITNNASIDITLDIPGIYTTYIAAIVGRAQCANTDAQRLKLIKCVNNGDFTVDVLSTPSNSSRLGSMIGHAYPGVWLIDCENHGHMTASSELAMSVGDICGTANSIYIENFISAGAVTSNAMAINMLNGLTLASKENHIVVAVTGKKGETLRNTYTGETYTFKSDGERKEFTIPYGYSSESKLNTTFDYYKYFLVNGSKRLYWFGMTDRKFITELNTADAIEVEVCFETPEKAIPISTAEQLLLMQKAINNGDTASIEALYALGGEELGTTDPVIGRVMLRMAYYSLQNDIVLDNDEFGGIGSVSSVFSGHFEGNGHTITLTLNQEIGSITSNTAFGLFGSFGRLGEDNGEVSNLSVVSSIELTLPKTNKTVWIGGFAGNGSGVTLNNVNVKVVKLNVTTNAASTGTAIIGGYFGNEGRYYGGTQTVEIACTINVNSPSHNGAVGGFCGQGSHGGNVIYTAGTGIVSNGGNSGAVIGYSSGGNDMRGITVENRTDGTIDIAATACAAVLLGAHTSTASLPESILLQIDETTKIIGKFTVGKT